MTEQLPPHFREALANCRNCTHLKNNNYIDWGCKLYPALTKDWEINYPDEFTCDLFEYDHTHDLKVQELRRIEKEQS